VRIEVYVKNIIVSPVPSIPIQKTCRDLGKLSDARLVEPIENSAQGALHRELFPPQRPEQGKVPPQPGHLADPVET
jgi:hypothetical protein